MGTLEGKHIIFLGSSVTYGAASGGISFVEYIAKRNGCTFTKEAVSGTMLTDDEPESYISRLKGIDTSIKADLFVCQLSTNDATKQKPIGSSDTSSDTTTVFGAIEEIVRYVSSVWHCPIAFYTSPRYGSIHYASMVNALHQIATEHKIMVIDMWSDASFNAMRKDSYMADAIHPTEEGYLEWWTPYIERQLQDVLK